MSAPRRHFLIPDTQVKPGEPQDHMAWIGAAIRDYAPDVLIHLGDHWDFQSLSTWSAVGSKDKEGLRLSEDIEAGNIALESLNKAMRGFTPKKKLILRGNHEHRLTRYIEAQPVLDGALGFDALNDRELGWTPVPYFAGSPQAIEIDGVAYAHYFANPNTGKPIAGTINNRLSKIGTSFVQGHVQGLLQGNVQYATGQIRHGIVAGSCYLADESYKGMANAHWRGVVILNEVRNGTFCEMPLSLDYLCRRYEGMSLARFLQRKYRRAKERFSLARVA